MSFRPERLARAYAACEALAQSHYENFPVSSRLLPGPMRPHVAAVYAFARVADDIADEGTDPPAIRKERLRIWQARLHHAVRPDSAGVSSTGKTYAEEAVAESRDELIFVALGHSIRSLNLPISLFDDLLSAFSQDITTTRYDSWDTVLDYCRRSANPVGRLVLRIAGRSDPALDRSSDALCTALQLTNFWQDFGRDWRAGRLYVPRSVQQSCAATEDELAGHTLTPAWVQVIEQCAAVTRRLFEEGRAVCDGVDGRLRFELRLTWLGGRRVLDRVVARQASLPMDRPALGAGDVPALLWRAVRWARAAA